MSKKLLICLITFLLALQCQPLIHASAVSFTPSFELNSQSGVLVSLDTGDTIYEKNPESPQSPAQLAQIMTAIICLETCPDIVGTTITANSLLFQEFASYPYPSDLRYADIQSGNILSVQDLLYAMMLTSSCEASVMLADYFGNGSIQHFVGLMNEKAKSIGATATNFCNPHGLYNEAQTTTARDMALITQYALQSVPHFEEIATAPSWTPTSITAAWAHSNIMTSETSNYYYNGAKGIKTGNLQQGGRTIATVASREGNNYLAILLNAPIYDAEGVSHYYHLDDATALFDWAFAHFAYTDILLKSEEIDELQVSNASDVDFVILKPREDFSMLWPDMVDKSSIQRIVTKLENVKAPVEQGEKLGEITLKLSGETLTTMDLVAAEPVERSFLKYNMSIMGDFFRSKWHKRAWMLAISLTLLYTAVCVYVFAMHRRKPKSVAGIRPKVAPGKRINRR